MTALDQILCGMRWAVVGGMALVALLLCVIFVLRIILALVRWRQRRLWQRMTGDERIADRARQHAEELREWRGE